MSVEPEEPSKPGRLEHAVHSLTGWLGGNASILCTLAAVAARGGSRSLFTARQDWQDALIVPLNALSFVLILLLQRSQNKDTLALQLKLNELIASQRGASNRLIDLESLSEAEVVRLHRHYQSL